MARRTACGGSAAVDVLTTVLWSWHVQWQWQWQRQWQCRAGLLQGLRGPSWPAGRQRAEGEGRGECDAGGHAETAPQLVRPSTARTDPLGTAYMSMLLMVAGSSHTLPAEAVKILAVPHSPNARAVFPSAQPLHGAVSLPPELMPVVVGGDVLTSRREVGHAASQRGSQGWRVSRFSTAKGRAAQQS